MPFLSYLVNNLLYPNLSSNIEHISNSWEDHGQRYLGNWKRVSIMLAAIPKLTLNRMQFYLELSQPDT